jgi:hypothetical protein
MNGDGKIGDRRKITAKTGIRVGTALQRAEL